MATNKSFLYLDISQLYRNYAMPYMTPTYPENIRLLGASTWEEIEAQHTHRQTDHRNSTPLTHYACGLLLIFYTQASLASLARLG